MDTATERRNIRVYAYASQSNTLQPRQMQMQCQAPADSSSSSVSVPMYRLRKGSMNHEHSDRHIERTPAHHHRMGVYGLFPFALGYTPNIIATCCKRWSSPLTQLQGVDGSVLNIGLIYSWKIPVTVLLCRVTGPVSSPVYSADGPAAHGHAQTLH